MYKTEFYGDWIHSNEPAAANIGRTALFVQNLYPRHSDKLIKKVMTTSRAGGLQ